MFAPSASAAEYVLEVAESIEGTGFGEQVVCRIYEGGEVVEEEELCGEIVVEGKKVVELEAIPEEGSEFVRFENGIGSASKCNGGTKTKCKFTLEADSYVEVRFDEITPALVIKTSGEGEVECAVEGSLPETCDEEYEFEAEVTLVPEPAEGWQFAKFNGGTGSASKCTGLTKPCSITLEKDSTVEAIFVPAMRTLTIAKTGTGTGTVTCNGGSCAPSYMQGTEVTLKATPASGSTFAGWSGGCAGTGSCVVAIEEVPVAVTATFTAGSPPPPEAKEGTASAAARAKVSGGKARVRVSCLGGLCKGTLRLSARVGPAGRRKNVVVGRTPFVLAEGESAIVPVRLSAAAKRQLLQGHTLRAKVAGSGVAVGAVTLKLASR